MRRSTQVYARIFGHDVLLALSDSEATELACAQIAKGLDARRMLETILAPCESWAEVVELAAKVELTPTALIRDILVHGLGLAPHPHLVTARERAAKWLQS